jgi:ubiquinone/menaquinone biosynthesis C-methylase UbiE
MPGSLVQNPDYRHPAGSPSVVPQRRPTKSNTDAARRGQIAASAAETYERDFVPALFGQFGPMLAQAAGVSAGDRVLDVGCGTGVASRAARALGAEVTGVDVNTGMLSVARRVLPEVRFVEGTAEDLPFGDDDFDAVLCQFVVMFLADRTAALRQMARVARQGAPIVLGTWRSVADMPGYNVLVPILGEVVGREAAEALSAPFAMGTPGEIQAELARAGLEAEAIREVSGTARFPSLDGWIDTEIGGWTLADMVSAAQTAEVKAAARARLSRFERPDGSVEMPAPARLTVIRA